MYVPLLTGWTNHWLIQRSLRQAVTQISEHDRNIVIQFASLLSSAIENARLFEKNLQGRAEAEDQARRLALLNEMGQQISLAGSTEEILQVVTQFVPQVIPADRVSVALLAETGDSLEVFALEGEAGVMPVGKRLPLARNDGRHCGPREASYQDSRPAGERGRPMHANCPDRACGQPSWRRCPLGST